AKAIVDSGQWLLYRYAPDRAKQGQNPLLLDSRPPKMSLKDYMAMETRFRILSEPGSTVGEALLTLAQQDVDTRWAMYEYLANRKWSNGTHGDGSTGTKGKADA
ncbi:MAG TPA: hypothetical protein VKQ72_17055, partial [Aggregatilineales bacterium]|nr:hypothetical protein [Aggregatilineales bacterium]